MAARKPIVIVAGQAQVIQAGDLLDSSVINWASPGAIGSTTADTGAFASSTNGVITLTVSHAGTNVPVIAAFTTGSTSGAGHIRIRSSVAAPNDGTIYVGVDTSGWGALYSSGGFAFAKGAPGGGASDLLYVGRAADNHVEVKNNLYVGGTLSVTGGIVGTLSVTGGIVGTVIGASSPAAGSFTTVTVSGPGGAAGRIYGDMTNATLSNRLSFQTTTADSTTALTVLPNGTSATSVLNLEGSATPSVTAGGCAQFGYIGTTPEVRIAVLSRNGGSYVPITFYNSGFEKMRLDTSGRLGIGATPTATFQVGAGDGSSAPPTMISGSSVVYAGRETIMLYDTDTAGIGVGSGIGFGGKYSAAGAFTRFAGVSGVKENATDANYSGALAFWTNVSGGAPSEVGRFSSAGNLGIGTSPSYRLHVYGTSNPEQRISDGTVQLQMYAATGTAAAVIGTVGSHDLIFRTGASERVRIDTNGNVGIGATPASRLHVETTTSTVVKVRTTGAVGAGRTFLQWLRLSGSDEIGWDISSNISLANDEFTLRQLNTAGGTNTRLVIDRNGNMGLGTGTFGTSAASVFSVFTGTAPSTGVADTVQFYSSDDAAGHTIPSFYCEGTNVVATGQADSASSVRVKMRINGTVRTFLCI